MRATALITGASAGIGHELARIFARSGHDVVITARRGDRLERIARDIEAEYGVAAHAVAADLAAAGGARALFDAVRARDIDIEYLVNNAGFGTFGPFADTDLAATMDLVRLNIAALTELSGLYLPLMVARGSGRIMNVASAAAFQAGPLMATYYASKAYVLHLSEAINEELAGTPVSVTALCPGPVRTEFQSVAGMENSRLIVGRRLIGVEEVAETGYRAMMAGKSFVVPGLASKILAWSVRCSPRRYVTKFVHRMQAERHP